MPASLASFSCKVSAKLPQIPLFPFAPLAAASVPADTIVRGPALDDATTKRFLSTNAHLSHDHPEVDRALKAIGLTRRQHGKQAVDAAKKVLDYMADAFAVKVLPPPTAPASPALRLPRLSGRSRCASFV